MSFSLPTRVPTLATAIAVVLAACAPATYTPSTSAPSTVTGSMSTAAPTPDPRVGLAGGEYNAAEAIWNLKVVSETRPSEKFIKGINSDLSLLGNYVFQGSFSGYQVCDISNPRQPVVKTA